jgi:hypothetical protein
MSENEIFTRLLNHDMPGYIIGLDRSPNAAIRFVSHIYRGTFSDPGDPMCPRGWNRDEGNGYSIWRNNLGRDICRSCLRAVAKELKI